MKEMKSFDWKQLKSNQNYLKIYEGQYSKLSKSLMNCGKYINKTFRCLDETGDKNKCETTIGELAFCLCNETHSENTLFLATKNCLVKKK